MTRVGDARGALLATVLNAGRRDLRLAKVS